MLAAEPLEPCAQPRALREPAADAHVDVVALREDPAVAARHRAELEHGAAAVALVRIRRVRLERDAALEARGQLRAVRPGGEQDDVRLEPLAARDDRPPVDPLDADALAQLGPALDRLLDQVPVEPQPLRHRDQRLPRAAQLAAAADAELDVVDELLEDRRHVAGRLPQRPTGQAAAAGLVAGKARPVEQQHRGAGVRQAARRCGACRPGSDHHDVPPPHPGAKATMRTARGGVPERPKGTGCKPVGSAYRGSNPLSPTWKGATVASERHGDEWC